MAKYFLSVHHREGDPVPSEAEMQRAFEQVDAFNEQLQSTGAWVFAGGLVPTERATVHGSGDAAVTIDGPFVESKENLGGFWIVDADDLDAALSLAADASEACANPVEVQPFADFSEVAPTAAAGTREYLLSISMGGEAPPRPEMTDEEMQASWQQMQALEADMQAQGNWMFSARLAGPDTATVVRSTAGEVVLTDGPFAESKEHLAGFYIVAADDFEAAKGLGRRVTACVHAPIEVRGFEVEA